MPRFNENKKHQRPEGDNDDTNNNDIDNDDDAFASSNDVLHLNIGGTKATTLRYENNEIVIRVEDYWMNLYLNEREPIGNSQSSITHYGGTQCDYNVNVDQAPDGWWGKSTKPRFNLSKSSESSSLSFYKDTYAPTTV